MATSENLGFAQSETWQANLRRIEVLNQRLIAASLQREARDPGLDGPSTELFKSAAHAMVSGYIANPAKVFEEQIGWWSRSLAHLGEVQASMVAASGGAPPSQTPPPKDPRFKNPLWQSHPWFNYLLRQYQTNADTLQRGVEALEGLSATEARRLRFFTGQLIDMMAPSNFLAGNPDALARAFETEGESLVRGLENLVADLERNDGELLVRLADLEAFTVGHNIATAAGAVVFRNELFELLHFTPTTETVHDTPLLIFPPWINKYYILDLKAQNSLIAWLVAQGHSVFVVSWRDPDAAFADVGMDSYILRGYLAAIKAVKEICDVPQINAVGYCIAGTTLSLVLALLAKTKDPSIKSATLLTTLTDFSERGEFTPFLEDDFVDGIEREARAKGYLSARIMSRTFSALRANDLVWQPAIRNYLMGEPPPAFDLLYWNSDSTNLPARMVIEYLRWLCQENRFAKAGFPFATLSLQIAEVNQPIFAVACETDHIAAWRDSYQGITQMGSPSRQFVLAQSGHIAGIINPPSKGKYGHYTTAATDLPAKAEDWKSQAKLQSGSWWPLWDRWLADQSTTRLPARLPGSASGYPALAPAPGTYVHRSTPL